jgi:hypothetical protein
MYCLESITALHPLVAPIAKRGSKRKRVGVARTRGGYNSSRGHRDQRFWYARDAFRVSRSPDFLAVTKYKRAHFAMKHEIHRASRTHAHRNGDSRAEESRCRGRYKDILDQRSLKEEERQKGGNTNSFFFRDQGCSVMFFFFLFPFLFFAKIDRSDASARSPNS